MGLGVSRRHRSGLAHLLGMDISLARAAKTERLLDPVLSLSELCEHLHVGAQTIYDLRSQGRGPHGFRVGRELRFRLSEVEAWLARLEAEDEQRHAEPGELAVGQTSEADSGTETGIGDR